MGLLLDLPHYSNSYFSSNIINGQIVAISLATLMAGKPRTTGFVWENHWTHWWIFLWIFHYHLWFPDLKNIIGRLGQWGREKRKKQLPIFSWQNCRIWIPIITVDWSTIATGRSLASCGALKSPYLPQDLPTMFDGKNRWDLLRSICLAVGFSSDALFHEFFFLSKLHLRQFG